MKVDVAICVYGKPYQTAMTLASLLHHSGDRIDRIFLQIDPVQPHGIDISPIRKVFRHERFVYHEPATHIGLEFYHGQSLDDAAHRQSIRYQYAWENTDKDFLLIAHNDCVFSADVVGGMLEQQAAGDFAGVGWIGQCWNCPAAKAGRCDGDRYASFNPSYEEALAIVQAHPGPRTVPEGIDRAHPMPFPECRLNEFACLIDMRKARPVTIPQGSIYPFGVMTLDIGTQWFRDMVLRGFRFKNWFQGVVHAPFSPGGNGFSADRDREIYERSEAAAAQALKAHFPGVHDALAVLQPP
ncbi:hypothetical protein [Acidisoma sp. C75]